MIAHRFVAYRYSGDLRIRAVLQNYFGSINYRCYIRPRGAPGAAMGVTIYVGLPAHLDRAVDAPETIDGIARAALSFAAAEGWPVDTYAASNDTGYLVTRKEVRR